VGLRERLFREKTAYTWAGQTQFFGLQGKDDLRSPLVEAKGRQARSMLSRMGRDDAKEVYTG